MSNVRREGEMSNARPAAQSSFPRPLPKMDGASAPYWKALREGRIELPRCTACRRFIFYPRSFCPHCQATDVGWEAVDGRGKIYTFTVVHKPTNPYFYGQAPYVYALIELECGVRLSTMLVQCEPDRVAVGDAVLPVFEAVSDDVTLLHFRPSG